MDIARFLGGGYVCDHLDTGKEGEGGWKEVGGGGGERGDIRKWNRGVVAPGCLTADHGGAEGLPLVQKPAPEVWHRSRSWHAHYLPARAEGCTSLSFVETRNNEQRDGEASLPHHLWHSRHFLRRAKGCTTSCLFASFANSRVQRCLTLVVPRMHIRSTVQEKCAQLCVLSPDSHVKRCPSCDILHIHTTSAVEEKCAQLGVSAVYSGVKRLSLTKRADNTGVNIQLTETQVAVCCRGNKRYFVDGKTLLAQRGNSTRSIGTISTRPPSESARTSSSSIARPHTSKHIFSHSTSSGSAEQLFLHESSKAAALFPRLHRHLRTSPRRRDVHCRAGSFWTPGGIKAVDSGAKK